MSYRVDNDMDHPIYLVARLFRRSAAGFAVDPDLVYTVIKDGVLQLTKAMVPVPDTMDVEVPEVPYVIEVGAKQHFEETIRVSLPVEPFHPYAGVKRVDEVRTFTKVELVLGWLSDGIKVDRIVRPGQQTELQVHHQLVAKQQRLLTAAISVPVPGHLAPP